jgi:hypothetical protein
MAQDTAETERDQTELGGEGLPSGPYLTDKPGAVAGPSIRESCLTRCPLLHTGRAWAASGST